MAVDKCLDTIGHAPPSLMAIQHCHGFGNNQLFRLNTKGQLGVGERCVEADAQGKYETDLIFMRNIKVPYFQPFRI